MNHSVHRVGLVVAVLAAVVTIGGYFAVDGYLNAHAPSAVTLSADVAGWPATAPGGALAPEVVYVRPAPSPQVIHVTQTATPAPRQVVRVVVPNAGGEPGENDRESGGEDD
jgi:hypothetical protein